MIGGRALEELLERLVRAMERQVEISSANAAVGLKQLEIMEYDRQQSDLEAKRCADEDDRRFEQQQRLYEAFNEMSAKWQELVDRQTRLEDFVRSFINPPS